MFIEGIPNNVPYPLDADEQLVNRVQVVLVVLIVDQILDPPQRTVELADLRLVEILNAKPPPKLAETVVNVVQSLLK